MQGGVADDPDTGGLDRLGLQRLMFDVFHEDIQLFRDYCLQVRGGGEAGQRWPS